MIDLASMLPKLLRPLLILAAGLVGQYALRLLVKRLVKGLSERDGPIAARMHRVDTLAGVVRNAGTVAIWSLVLITFLSELGVNIAPLITGAGLVGLAVGFGSQTLVKDFLGGIFILLENQFNVGDRVAVGGKTGMVKEIKLRSTTLVDDEGNLHTIPNSKIDIISRLK